MKTIVSCLTMLLISGSLLMVNPTVATAQDADGDGSVAKVHGGDDCDDSDPRRYPGNTEVADRDNHDEDCDPTTFGTEDKDRDGFVPSWACNRAPDGTLNCGTDCNDNDPAINPGQLDICNRRDDNCDGSIDEDQPCSQIPIWIDEARKKKEEREQQKHINEMTEKGKTENVETAAGNVSQTHDLRIEAKNKNRTNQHSKACFNAVQGRIAWDQNGENTRWSASNIEKLCAGAVQSTEPAACFRQVMHDNTPTGNGVNQWTWSRAIKLCSGTSSARSTIDCYKNEIAGGKSHSEALKACSGKF